LKLIVWIIIYATLIGLAIGLHLVFLNLFTTVAILIILLILGIAADRDTQPIKKAA